MESWLPKQSENLIISWGKIIEQYYPQNLESWTDPNRHLRALTDEWNYLAATTYLNWDRYLVGSQLRIIDLGAGTGWLSVMLSKRTNVTEIYALDASPTNLTVMLPALTELMEGDLGKIKPILGLFTPLLIEDEFFDLAVASAAVHHAPDLAELIAEVYRVIKPGGFFIILNELPVSSTFYAMTAIYRCLKILRTIFLKRWQPISKPISESNFITDPFLGDRSYCDWQYRAAIQTAGFSFEPIQTPYYPYQKTDDRRNTIKFTHFIAQKLR